MSNNETVASNNHPSDAAKPTPFFDGKDYGNSRESPAPRANPHGGEVEIGERFAGDVMKRDEGLARGERDQQLKDR